MNYNLKSITGRLIGRLLAVVLVLGICLTGMADKDPVRAAETKNVQITVNSADRNMAQKLHDVLQREQAVTLKVKGSEVQSKNVIKSLQKQIGKVNCQGVIFQCHEKDRAGGYCLWEISRSDAKLYFYSVKFVEKIFAQAKKNIRENIVDERYENKILSMLERAKKLYPDPVERENHILYEMMLSNCWAFIDDSKYNYTTILIEENEEEVGYPSSKICNTDYDLLEKCIISENGKKYNDYKTFLKKATQEKIDNVKDLYHVFLYKEQLKLLTETKNFCDLSDAMKILAIDTSGYFGSRTNIYDDFQVDYHMEYSRGRTYCSDTGVPWRNMKTLYEGKAIGVCHDFAEHECLLFDQLAISNTGQSSDKINHAWSVVHVKNSKGKSLWIPFDYGIGPAHSLENKWETMRYVLTRKKRYETYLEGVKGAPKYKNFTDDDFN